MHQARQFGVRLVHGMLQPPDYGVWDSRSPVGMPRILAYLEENPGHVGTLVALSSSGEEWVREWAREVMRHGMPLVWFDPNARAERVPLPSPLVTRFSYSEQRQADAAVDFLQDAGHRHIAYLMGPEGAVPRPWIANRLAACRNRIGTHEGMRITVIPPHDRCRWERPSRIADDLAVLSGIRNGPIRRALDFFGLRGTSGARDARPAGTPTFGTFLGMSRERFRAPAAWSDPRDEISEHCRVLWVALELTPLLLTPSISAVICPNDLIGRGFLRWLRTLAIDVPGGCSVISFDNRLQSMPIELTSVDPGFELLGYRGFHAILGDVPVRRDRNGVITAEPRVNDRVSVLRSARPRAASPHRDAW
jgi:hypothetical protein